MVLVPLLVGISMLIAAYSVRLERQRQFEEPDLEIVLSDPARRESPLAEAFPHLRLWIPSEDAIYRATHRTPGKKGPDIVLRPVVRRREFSDAA